ncbi:unnamed protein product [Vicia faba]|uniref:Uncharacterized protein n=1 Tax=Vicia faba TaxID=3906 RepID=A0AAV0YNK7_VICFA|nr:unnamed protein product [Vicia faba]
MAHRKWSTAIIYGETSELIYKFLVTKLIVGMPFKDLATDTSILLRKLPSADDVTSQIVKRSAAAKLHAYYMSNDSGLSRTAESSILRSLVLETLGGLIATDFLVQWKR